VLLSLLGVLPSGTSLRGLTGRLISVGVAAAHHETKLQY